MDTMTYEELTNDLQALGFAATAYEDEVLISVKCEDDCPIEDLETLLSPEFNVEFAEDENYKEDKEGFRYVDVSVTKA